MHEGARKAHSWMQHVLFGLESLLAISMTSAKFVQHLHLTSYTYVCKVICVRSGKDARAQIELRDEVEIYDE